MRHQSSSDGLAARSRGRCQRTQPQRRQPEAPLSKPSRQGEVVLYNDFTGWAVARWFKQLRRLQSLRFAIKSVHGTSSGTASTRPKSLRELFTDGGRGAPFNIKERHDNCRASADCGGGGDALQHQIYQALSRPRPLRWTASWRSRITPSWRTSRKPASHIWTEKNPQPELGCRG